MWYIHAEDFVAGLVGPFATLEECGKHIEFMRIRGDASVIIHGNQKIMSEEEAKQTCAWEWKRTPENDKMLDELWELEREKMMTK